ncbi:MAG: hypothetical protein ACI9P7_000107 [Candidatus Azotimanducaceae bacterium]|jgi:hypothetical protein
MKDNIITDSLQLIERLSQPGGADVLADILGSPDASPKGPSSDIGSIVDVLKQINNRRESASMDNDVTLAGTSSSIAPTQNIIAKSMLADNGEAPEKGLEHRRLEKRYDPSTWSAIQQELRLWCFGNSTGGRFVVLNEHDHLQTIYFEAIRPVSVSSDQWATIDISFSDANVELQAHSQDVIGLRLKFNDYLPSDSSLDFCVDVRAEGGGLVCKLWVEVAFIPVEKMHD